MKRFMNGVAMVAFIGGIFMMWPVLNEFSVLFLFSRIERLGEIGLPNARIGDGNIVYCRMKADDFRFPLPPGSHAELPAIESGGFDTVNGHVEVHLDPLYHFAADRYKRWLEHKTPEGATISAETIPEGLMIKFSYFGDR